MSLRAPSLDVFLKQAVFEQLPNEGFSAVFFAAWSGGGQGGPVPFGGIFFIFAISVSFQFTCIVHAC